MMKSKIINKSSANENSTNKYHSLNRRIVAQFCVFTLVLSCFYSAFVFLAMYALEDSFIYTTMAQEAQLMQEDYRQHQQWPIPRHHYMKLYLSKESLPELIKVQLLTEPNAGEFFGEQGKHYHLYALPKLAPEKQSDAEQAYLLAEVSEMLLVRPISGFLLKAMLVVCLVLIIIACTIAWLLGRSTARPLQRLADLVDGVAPENIPDKFAQRFPNNEIGLLAQTLENTLGQIKSALIREKHFTRDVSHELRTPVAIIKNAVEVYQTSHTLDPELPQQQLLQQQLKQKATDALIKRISDASVQMEQTVTTLLSLARNEHTSVAKSSVNLLALVEQAVIDHSYLLANKTNGNLVEVLVSDNTNVNLTLQPGMLKVLLDNLISNAFQYTNAGEVLISYENNQLVIADTGSGIEASIVDKVTELMVKGSQSTGYGFGLSIVKRLCEHQGWQLSLKSEQGTQISVRF